MKSLSQLAHFYFWQARREAVEAAVMVKSSVIPIRSALQAHGVATPTPGWSGGSELQSYTVCVCFQFTDFHAKPFSPGISKGAGISLDSKALTLTWRL